MLTMNLDFECSLCGKEDFYIMPEKIKTISKDYTRSITEYEVVCKHCNKTHTLTINIDAL